MNPIPLVRVFLALTLLHAANLPAADSAPQSLEIGAAAPDFTLPGVDGRDWSLSDFSEAKALAVVFTCNHCPTARYYEDRIKQLVTDYKDKDFALVAISPNDPDSVRLDELGWADLSDSFEEMVIHAEHAGFNFPYLYDGDEHGVARRYGPVATPHVFLFNDERKLVYAGAIDDSERVQHVTKNYLRDAIDATLAGTTPGVTQTKVVGCSVKWSGKEHLVADYMKKLANEPVSVEMADVDAMKDLRKNDSGKFRLVNFWATWCAPCIAEFPEFVTINRMYRHRDFEMVLVSVNRPDERDRVLDLLKKQEASNRNLLFASADREPLINAFDPDWQGEVPYTVLLNPEGEVIYRESGTIDPLAMKRAILKAMNERKPW